MEVFLFENLDTLKSDNLKFIKAIFLISDPIKYLY